MYLAHIIQLVLQGLPDDVIYGALGMQVVYIHRVGLANPVHPVLCLH